jgi:hypothetical protein
MAGTGEETERKDDGGVASWLGAPSYAPDATENAELPWTLKPPVVPPSAEPQSEHDFVVVPREGDGPASSSRSALGKRPVDPDNWSVRESEHKHEPIVIPINEALVPKPPPPPAMRRAALALLARWDRATPRQRIGITTGAVAVVAGMFVGLMLSSIFRPAPAPPAFPGKTYHVPEVLGGIGAAPALSAQASALQGGLTTLAPSAHTEVADYSDAAGNIDYELALVQDNLGHSVLRFDSDLASQFPDHDFLRHHPCSGVCISRVYLVQQLRLRRLH